MKCEAVAIQNGMTDNDKKKHNKNNNIKVKEIPANEENE